MVPLVPRRLLTYTVCDDTIVPDYLEPGDHPWLRALIEVFDRHAGRRWREVCERLREPLPFRCPRPKLKLAAHVLHRLWRRRPHVGVAPRRARELVFLAAAGGGERERVLAEVAQELGIAPLDLERSLFADLESEECLEPVACPPSPGALALRVNLALAQGLIACARSLSIELRGNARAVVRSAQLHGLICSVQRAPPDRGGAPALEISGPLALFRHTRLYAAALQALVPVLAWCPRFHLRARCEIEGRELALVLASGDPIFPGEEPRRFDSQLEERFARDLARLAPDWDLVREPEPVPAGEALIFPDFALEHRHDPARRAFVEIVGFWTRDYLERKLEHLRRARLGNLVLCIDAGRGCDAVAELPEAAAVIRFRRRLDARAVVLAIDQLGGRR
jgi:predicted nuclease of restriction endonuclease-like RecB superfamily